MQVYLLGAMTELGIEVSSDPAAKREIFAQVTAQAHAGAMFALADTGMGQFLLGRYRARGLAGPGAPGGAGGGTGRARPIGMRCPAPRLPMTAGRGSVR